MRFTLVVRQAAVVDAGLVDEVSVVDLCLLDYLRGWLDCDRAQIVVVEGSKFVWLHGENAIAELPLLFKPQAKLASRKNQLSAMIGKLRNAGLVETIRVNRRLFFRFTDLAARVTQRRGHSGPTSAKSAPIGTPPRDEIVTPGQDTIVTSSRDDYLPTHMDETGINETESNETPPLSPCEGVAASILAHWNSFPQLPPMKTITPNRARKIRKRLADLFWREHWQEGIRRASASSFLTGNGSHGWRATLDWFLGGDSLARILEGTYDNRLKPDRKPFLSELKAQLKAVDDLIASNPANHYYSACDEDVTSTERDDLRRLKRRREELVRQLAGVPE